MSYFLDFYSQQNMYELQMKYQTQWCSDVSFTFFPLNWQFVAAALLRLSSSDKKARATSSSVESTQHKGRSVKPIDCYTLSPCGSSFSKFMYIHVHPSGRLPAPLASASLCLMGGLSPVNQRAAEPLDCFSLAPDAAWSWSYLYAENAGQDIQALNVGLACIPFCDCTFLQTNPAKCVCELSTSPPGKWQGIHVCWITSLDKTKKKKMSHPAILNHVIKTHDRKQVPN